MSFDTPFFLSVFLPALILLYTLTPGQRVKNVLLLLVSLLFCAFGSISGMITLIIWGLVNYILGLLLIAGKKVKALGVCLNLTFLFLYKYLNFFAGELFHLSHPVFSPAVPLGISFFTFKCMSYLLDTAKSKENGTKNFFSFLLYLSFFPQITAGPITRFRDFAPQLSSPRKADLPAGLTRFIWGLGKKLLLSLPMSRIASGTFGVSGLTADLAWLGAIAYMMEIYFDFSGYSDMAIGLGKVFGFDTPENFLHPYIADSIGDFWRRWHISLSQWFRDYLYIPLGGNRKGKLRAALNKCIVFTLCGFWHGASWTYLLWGLWHGLFSGLETLIPVKKYLGKVFSHVYTLLVVMLGFVLFRAGSFTQGMQFLGAMFGVPGIYHPGLLQNLVGIKEIVTLALCVIFCFPVEKYCRLPKWAVSLLNLGLLILCILTMAASGFRPFIYAQF